MVIRNKDKYRLIDHISATREIDAEKAKEFYDCLSLKDRKRMITNLPKKKGKL
jgi:hypothetical protein